MLQFVSKLHQKVENVNYVIICKLFVRSGMYIVYSHYVIICEIFDRSCMYIVYCHINIVYSKCDIA
jgi:hypothetical protein